MDSTSMSNEVLGSQELDLATALVLLPSLLIVFFTPTYVYHHARLIINRPSTAGSWAKMGIASALFWMEAQVCSLPQPLEADIIQVFASCVYIGLLCLMLALYVEHQSLFQGPGLLVACFVANILFDASKAYAMLTLQGSVDPILTALIFQKASIVVLESGPRSLKEGRDLPRNRQRRSLFGVPIATNSVDDLPELDEELRPDHLHLQLEQAWHAVNHEDPNCLWKAFYLAFPQLTLGAVFSRTCLSVCTFSQPLLMIHMIRVAEMEQVTLNESTSLLAMTALVYGGIALAKSYTGFMTSRLSLSLRGALSAVVATLGDGTTGMGTHVTLILSMYGDFADTVAGVVLLVALLGAVGLTSVVPLLAFAIIAFRRTPEAVLFLEHQRTAENNRIAALSRFLPSLKDIKVIGLEPVLTSFIRRVEVNDIEARNVSVGHWVFGHILLSIFEWSVPAITLASSLAAGDFSGGMSIATTFPPLAIGTLLIAPMMKLPEHYIALPHITTSFRVLRNFLLLEEHMDNRLTGPTTASIAVRVPDASRAELQSNRAFLTGPFVCMFFSNLSVWSTKEEKHVFKNISGFFLASRLNMIIGPVACGKSVLLTALLGEVEANRGTIQLRKGNRVAYCGQLPWIPNTTIRQCIVSTNRFDVVWYLKVVKACDLDLDFLQLPDGDQSTTGSGGSLLSGGQKQRVALARAVYSEADILLLDDTFSSLDRITARRIFMRLFGKDGLVKQAKLTTIMSTHSVEYLPEADHILAFSDDGTLKPYDNFFDLQTNDATLDALRHSEEFATDESNWQHGQTQSHNPAEKPNLLNCPNPTVPTSPLAASDWTMAKFFFGLIPKSALTNFCVFATLTTIVEETPGVLARIWIETRPDEYRLLAGYFIFISIQPIVHLRAYRSYQQAIISARGGLSSELCHTLARASIPALARLDSGFLVGRFVDDSNSAHKVVTEAMILSWSLAFCLADFAVLILASTFFISFTPFVIILSALLMLPYQKARRGLISLEVRAKTSIQTRMMEITTGLRHIRAFGWQEHYLQDVFEQLHTWQKASFYQLAAERWFKLGVELIMVTTAMLIAIMAAHSASANSSPASIALAIFILMRPNFNFIDVATAWVAYSTHMSAILSSYNFIRSTPEELGVETMAEPLPAIWPSEGDLTVQELHAGYGLVDGQESSVIKDITFRLLPGYRIGIVGRTGSGKTSLALAILNSLSFNGSISIDGVDVSTIPPQELRRRITTITQDPVELPGSVRDNIVPPDDDRLRQVDDGTILSVLEKIGLLQYIQDRGGIHASLSAMEFSQGHKQLVCLARAIIHHSATRGRLIIIDEATSSVDYDTDRVMQKVITEAFAGCTMLIIAHRVESLRGVDYLLELEGGRVASLLSCSERATTAG